MTHSDFPTGLLDEPPERRREYFRGYTVIHTAMKEAVSQLVAAIEERRGSLVFVYGPSGVGKSKLLDEVQSLVTSRMLAGKKPDPLLTPIVRVTARSSDTFQFSWRDLYIDLLASMGEPCPDRRINYREWDACNGVGFHPNRSSTASDLRYGLCASLEYHKPAAIMIDESQHIEKTASGRRYKDQLDIIKGLVEETGVTHVLIGTYEILPMTRLSAQLIRRSWNDVHFPRYRFGVTDDERDFQGVIRAFERHLPVAEEPDLLSHWEFLYERSIGCIGLLKQWLALALGMVLRSGAQTITVKDLERCALSASQCLALTREATEGERQLIDRSEAQLRSELGMDYLHAIEEKTASDAVASISPAKRKPGRRKPKRDPVGDQSGNAVGV